MFFVLITLLNFFITFLPQSVSSDEPSKVFFRCILCAAVLLSAVIQCGDKKTTTETSNQQKPARSAPATPNSTTPRKSQMLPASENNKSSTAPTPSINKKSETVTPQKEQQKEENKTDGVESKNDSKQSEVNDKEADKKPEDSFDALQPRKAEATRAKEIKGEKVPNKGDYKTWANYDVDDFDKSLDEEFKKAKNDRKSKIDEKKSGKK